MSRVPPTLQSLMKIDSAVVPPHGGEIYGSRAFYFFLFLISLTRLQPKPLNRFQCTIAQKTRTDSRKCPLSKCFPIFSLLRAHFPRKPLTISLPVGKSHANNKMSNNFRSVRVRTKVTIEHLQEVGVALSESIISFSLRRRLAELFEVYDQLNSQIIVLNCQKTNNGAVYVDTALARQYISVIKLFASSFAWITPVLMR